MDSAYRLRGHSLLLYLQLAQGTYYACFLVVVRISTPKEGAESLRLHWSVLYKRYHGWRVYIEFNK